MSAILAVPIHLDALYLKSDRLGIEPMANFSRLAYVSQQRDVNSNIAYISEEIVSRPFQNQNLSLKPGIHLHWSLPDALTEAIQVKCNSGRTNTIFRQVPDRWLVTRSQAGKLEKQWIVESDYLYPAAEGVSSGSIIYPVEVKSHSDSSQPYRYMGRKIPLSLWQAAKKGKYFKKLTAVGYGEPTFAAFYPNCHSVFGFHDRDYIDNVPQGLQYEVIGWYGNSKRDYLYRLAKEKNISQIESHWAIPTKSEEAELPKQMVCHARLVFQPEEVTKNSNQQADVEIAVGNTATEALSAYLGHKVSSDRITAKQTEDWLEALHLSSQLKHQRLDLSPKFYEARHEKGYTGVTGGSLWTIRSRSEDSNFADVDTARTQQEISLPEDLAGQLDRLNLCQKAYDQALYEIESLRERVFSDWYKYMLSAYPPIGSRDEYPDIDEVKHFIEVKEISALEAKLKQTGILASELANAKDRLIKAIDSINQSSQIKKSQLIYVLGQILSPRYWQPNEPAILVAGEAAKATVRHGQDGRLREDSRLECSVIEDEGLCIPQSQDDVPKLYGAIAKIYDDTKESIAITNWQQQPWHPFLLEWEVEVFPRRSGSNHTSLDRKYKEDFLTQNYCLKENAPDLTLCEGKAAVSKAANIYSGRSILTPHAEIKLKIELENYLKREVLNDYYEKYQISQKERQDYLTQSSNIEKIESWYRENRLQDSDSISRKLVHQAILAYQHLLNTSSIAQSLGGFNQALLMHKQTMQLPIADPLGFADYQSFAKEVAKIVGRSIRNAPEPQNDFNPIRSGVMKILRLRLVDTFGQIKELDVSQVITAEAMKTAASPNLVSLPPRLVQPARLNFRWLSADGEIETNDHPTTTPICGWILPNNLDSSLAFYDASGTALGSIDYKARWRSAPGKDVAIAKDEISNLYLRRVVEYLSWTEYADEETEDEKLKQKKQDLVAAFISTLDSGLEKIEPENFAQHQGLALLMGRPIAIVRASLGLQLKGLPAISHGWSEFWQDMRRNTRENHDFTKVKLPIRLGEYKQFNDGLLGYWQEEGNSLGEMFYAPQSDNQDDNPQIRLHSSDKPWHLDLSLDDPPQTLTMLIDPRGKVHATSGILPTKAIAIPPTMYQTALEQIEIAFLSTPILTDLKQLNLPLPEEANYQWSWIEKVQNQWSAIAAEEIGGVKSNATFSTQQVIREGWLKLSPSKGDTESDTT